MINFIKVASFPYCKKRIEVQREDSIQISPLQIAINSLKKKNRELNDVISHEPLDLKKLQLRLQGSVLVTVNSGSLTYARAFIGNTGLILSPIPPIHKYSSLHMGSNL